MMAWAELKELENARRIERAAKWEKMAGKYARAVNAQPVPKAQVHQAVMVTRVSETVVRRRKVV